MSKPDGVYKYEVLDYDGTPGYRVTDPDGEVYEDQGGSPNSPRRAGDVVPHLEKLIDSLSKKNA